MLIAKMMGVITVAAIAFAVPAHGKETTSTRIDLPVSGKSGAYNGTIRGHENAEYVFQGTAGQKLRIDMKADNRSTFFNVVQDGKPEAIFVGSIDGNTYNAALPGTGTYRVKVYLMRNAARQNIRAKYELRLR